MIRIDHLEPRPDRTFTASDNGNTVTLTHYPPGVTLDRPSGLGFWDVHINGDLAFRINDTALGDCRLDFDDMVAKLQTSAADHRRRAEQAERAAERADARAGALAAVTPALVLAIRLTGTSGGNELEVAADQSRPQSRR